MYPYFTDNLVVRHGIGLVHPPTEPNGCEVFSRHSCPIPVIRDSPCFALDRRSLSEDGPAALDLFWHRPFLCGSMGEDKSSE